MKQFRLVLITENQNARRKAEGLAELVCKILDCENDYEIYKYEKFKHSYRIVFTGKIADPDNSISESITRTDRICSPWLVSYYRDKGEIDLLFNKSEFSRYRDNRFNVLRWAKFEIEPHCILNDKSTISVKPTVNSTLGIKRREEIWASLSDVFIDNEIDYSYIATQVADVDLPLLKEIFFNEVAPCCGPNLMCVIPPIWAGFCPKELAKDIRTMQIRNSCSRVARLRHKGFVVFCRWYFRSDWNTLATEVEKRRK